MLHDWGWDGELERVTAVPERGAKFPTYLGAQRGKCPKLEALRTAAAAAFDTTQHAQMLLSSEFEIGPSICVLDEA